MSDVFLGHNDNVSVVPVLRLYRVLSRNIQDSLALLAAAKELLALGYRSQVHRMSGVLQ